MAEKHLVVAVDWSGPYGLIAARGGSANDFKGGLYVSWQGEMATPSPTAVCRQKHIESVLKNAKGSS